MGGELTVRSTLGVGSSFKIRLFLPEALHPAGVSAGDTQVASYEGKRIRVLIADDDEDHRGVLRDLLVPLGFTVQAVADGASCLVAAETVAPDVVLLDISMPGLSGWEVASRLRAMGRHQMRIIMISGNTTELDLDRGRLRDHDATLQKPIDLQVLVETIGRLT